MMGRMQARGPGKASGTRRRRWPLVALIASIAAVVIVACAGCFGGLWLFVQRTIQSTEIYDMALARAKAEPAVVERLGEPIEARSFIMGNVNVTNDAGAAEMQIPLRGPEGSCVVHVSGSRLAGQWTIEHLSIEFGDAERVILDPAGEANEHTDHQPQGEASP